MRATKRACTGALGGAGATLVLSALRAILAKMGLVLETAPWQVMERLEELGLLDEVSPQTRRVLTGTVHLAFGIGAGVVFGLLRARRGEAGEETAVGSSLGVLVWAASWAGWLPLAGVHRPPWKQRSPRVLLPILDHAVFGAAWGLFRWLLTREK
jgi:hypothetical protein